MNNSHNTANFRRKKKRQWKPISIEDVPFRRQDRMTLSNIQKTDRICKYRYSFHFLTLR